jgi:hypothetical protein
LTAEIKERPDPATPTRVTWECPGCGQIHHLTEPRDEALETARNLLAGGVAWTLVEDANAAVMREQDLAERAHRIMSAPGFIVEIGPARKAPWWDVRRYRKG